MSKIFSPIFPVSLFFFYIVSAFYVGDFLHMLVILCCPVVWDRLPSLHSSVNTGHCWCNHCPCLEDPLNAGAPRLLCLPWVPASLPKLLSLPCSPFPGKPASGSAAVKEHTTSPITEGPCTLLFRVWKKFFLSAFLYLFLPTWHPQKHTSLPSILCSVIVGLWFLKT